MAETIEITLGSRRFAVRRLTLRQLRDIETASGKHMSVSGTRNVGGVELANIVENATDLAVLREQRFERSFGVVMSALRRDFGDVTEASLLDDDTIEPAHVHDAAVKVLRLAGMIPPGEGEGNPSASATSTGS